MIPFLENYKIAFLAEPAGGFFVFGILIALVNMLTKGKYPKKKSFGCEGCANAAACSGDCSSVKENNTAKEDVE